MDPSKFERRPSAGKQVQWAEVLGDEFTDRLKKDGLRTALRNDTAGSGATARSRAETALEPRFPSSPSSKSAAPPKTPATTAEAEAGHRRQRPFTVQDEHRPLTLALAQGADNRSVVFCGLQLSVDDLVRARGIKAAVQAERRALQDDRKHFTEIDTDYSGEITIDELRAYMLSEDPKVTEEQVQNRFNRMDRNTDGAISKKEFLGVTKFDRKRFSAIDTDQSGEITLDELRASMQRDDPSVTEEQVQERFDKLDRDKSGTASQQEFLFANTENPLFSPQNESPLTKRRAARLERRNSRAAGIDVDKGESSEEDLKPEEIEQGILQADAADIEIHEAADQPEAAADKPEAAAESLFLRVDSSGIPNTKELKKRKKKKAQGAPNTEEQVGFDRVLSTHSAVSNEGEVRKNAKLPLPRSSEIPKFCNGEIKIKMLLDDMTVERVVAADESIAINYDDEKYQKCYVLDLEGADEVDEVAKVLENYSNSMHAHKYLTLNLGSTGFGSKMKGLQPHFQNLSRITALGLHRSISHKDYVDGLAEAEPSGLNFSFILQSFLAPPPMTCLTELNLSQNFLRAEGAKQLKEILMYNSLLTSLDLSSNDIFCKGLPPIVDALSTVCTHLRALYLNSNWIGCEGVAALAPVFGANTCLLELDISQNAIAEDGCVTLSEYLQMESMGGLNELRILGNRICEVSQKCMFPAITASTSLTSLKGLEGGTLGPFYDYILMKIVASKNHLKVPSTDFIKELDLSHSHLKTFPMVLLELNAMKDLNVSHNYLTQLPYIELCAQTSLTKLDCVGNPNLMYPEKEVIEKGGLHVMSYIREAQDDSHFNILVLLIPVGEIQAGKTSLLKALESPKFKYDETIKYYPTIAPDLRVWTPLPNILDFKVVDTSGSQFYAVTHEFFTSPSSLFLFVWRLENPTSSSRENIHNSIDRMSYRWLSKLHYSTPGAMVLAVATHVDTIETVEVIDQCDWMEQCLKKHVKNIHHFHPAPSALKLLNGGKSLTTSANKGFGIEELKKRLIVEAKRIWLWGLPLNSSFRALRKEIHTTRARSNAVEISWKEFKELAVQSGYTCDENLKLAVRLLHDLHEIRYWGDVETAWHASDDPKARVNDPLNTTIYIDIEWCSGTFRGLIRSQREALLRFFGGRIRAGMDHETNQAKFFPENKAYWNLTKRAVVEGRVDQRLMGFMWPDEARTQEYWNALRLGTFGKLEQDQWPEHQGNLAKTPDDYILIQNLLIRFGIMCRENEDTDNFFVPFLKASSHRRTLDSRSVAYNDCPYTFKFAWKGTPEQFWIRLSVDLASKFKSNHIQDNFAVFYDRDLKVLLFFTRKENEDVLMARSTLRRGLEIIKERVSVLEFKYPGLRRSKVAQALDKDTSESDQPVQVFISHSSDGLDASEALLAALLEKDSTLRIITSHTHRNDSMHIPSTRIFIPLMDNRYHQSQRCRKEFNDAVQQGAHIVALILPAFEFPLDEDSLPNYQKWWAHVLPGMAKHPLFINFQLKKDNAEVAEKAKQFNDLKFAAEQGTNLNPGQLATSRLQLDLAKETLETNYQLKIVREIYGLVVKILDRVSITFSIYPFLDPLCKRDSLFLMLGSPYLFLLLFPNGWLGVVPHTSTHLCTRMQLLSACISQIEKVVTHK